MVSAAVDWFMHVIRLSSQKIYRPRPEWFATRKIRKECSDISGDSKQAFTHSLDRKWTMYLLLNHEISPSWFPWFCTPNRTLCLRIDRNFQVLQVLENTLTAGLAVSMFRLLRIESCISRPSFLTVPCYMEVAGKPKGCVHHVPYSCNYELLAAL